ncbi:MAG TPA: DUF5320 domain-containing protein [Treponemataceae bacterium]|nr:DUF5320 domain-containing protein [Treponemataceae bacterium]
MPRGDRTGPAGMGPMTGRGAGFCAGYGNAGYMNPEGTYNGGRGLGRSLGRGGRGFGGGLGRGLGRGFAGGFAGGFMQNAAMYQGMQKTEEDEKYELNARSHSISIELELIQKRLAELNGGEK